MLQRGGLLWALGVSVALGCTGLGAQTSTYDAIGRLVWSHQPGGVSTTYAYDPNGNLTATGSVGAGADTDGDGLPDYYEIRYAGTLTRLTASADDDADGIINLQEFAFARNPKASDSEPLTPTSIQPPSDTNSYFTLTYRRPKTASVLLNYTHEVSFDLVTWSSAPADVEQTGVVDVGGGVERVTVRALSPMANQTRIFLRVRITKR